MANISSQFKKASELYQRAVQQYQVKQKEQRSLIDQFKVGDSQAKARLKPYLIALHKDMQYHQELVDRAELAFEKALAGEPIDLGEDVMVKNKKTGNVYSVKNANPAIHSKPSASDIAQAKADNGGDVKTEPTKGPKLDVDKQSHIKDIPKKFRSMVSMKIDQLAKAAAEAKAKGEKAPNFNLCDITIPGTNLYCKGNKGIPREDMPQFKGYAKPGSIADKLPKNNDGEVDTESQFKVLLKKNGVKVSEPQEVPADQLKATQTELVGAKVAGMTKALEKEPNHPKITAPIYVSNDGYVLDGHHRWAAVTSAAVASGKPAMMNIRVIDMPIKDLVKISNEFADQIGIQQKKADANAEAPKKVGANEAKPKKEVQSFIPNVGNIDDFKLKSLLQNNPKVKNILGPEELKFLNQSDTDVIKVSGKPFNTITTDGKYEFELDLKKGAVVKSFRKARPAIISHYNESVIKKVTEVTTNDWHYKAIMAIWDKGGSFTRKKIGTILLKDPKANRRDIEDALRTSDYDEVTDVTDRLRIEGIIKEEDSAETLKGLKEMAMGDLERIEDYAEMISDRMKEGQDLESWMYSQITLAVDQLNSVHDAMDGNDGVKESVNESSTNPADIIKDLDKVRHDLIKKVDVLIAKKKKLYANVDITTPMSADEKQLDKDIQSIFSQIQGIIQQKRKIKNETVIKEDENTTDDESGMFISNIKSTMESAQSIQQTIQSKGEVFNVPAWVQAKTALASDYLHSISRYYKGNPDQE
jgi:hypothetical protein